MRIVIDDPGSFGVMQRHVDGPRWLLVGLGEIVVAGAGEAFAEQGRPAGSWEPRGVPNIAGIIRDLHVREIPHVNRFRERPVLFDNGTLSKATGYEVTGTHEVTVGVFGPARAYAAKQHDGGESETEEITETVQRRLWSWLKSAGRDWKRTLGWLLNRKFRGTTLTINIRPRPWLQWLDQDTEDAAEMLGVRLVRKEGEE